MIANEELLNRLISPEAIQRMCDKYIKHLSEVTKREGDKIKEDINRRVSLDYIMNDFKIKLFWEGLRTPPSILDSLARYF
jgi:hypothetical protein